MRKHYLGSGDAGGKGEAGIQVEKSGSGDMGGRFVIELIYTGSGDTGGSPPSGDTGGKLDLIYVRIMSERGCRRKTHQHGKLVPVL